MEADRDTTIGDDSANALRSMLESVRLDGAIFLRAEYTEDWSYESPAAEDLAGMLRPGRRRLVLFHIVAAGRCWVAVDGERHWADRGDVIVLPYGDRHRMGGTTEAEAVPIASLMAPPPWEDLPVIRHGAGGERTDVVCGYLDSDDPLFDPGLRALPPVFVVRPSPAAAAWVEASIAYAMAAPGDASVSLVTRRLPELLLVEVLRLHLATTPAAGVGWLHALRDPVLAPALARLHGDPARRWTVDALAAEAVVSRSLLDDRFRSVLGRSPMRYLREWRMHVARDLLASTPLTVAAVGRRVGYDAEEAFSRAFKRSVGDAPARWRAAWRERDRPT